MSWKNILKLSKQDDDIADVASALDDTVNAGRYGKEDVLPFSLKVLDSKDGRTNIKSGYSFNFSESPSSTAKKILSEVEHSKYLKYDILQDVGIVFRLTDEWDEFQKKNLEEYFSQGSSGHASDRGNGGSGSPVPPTQIR